MSAVPVDFEDDLTPVVTCPDCGGEIRGAEPEEQGTVYCIRCVEPPIYDEFGGYL